MTILSPKNVRFELRDLDLVLEAWDISNIFRNNLNGVWDFLNHGINVDIVVH